MPPTAPGLPVVFEMLWGTFCGRESSLKIINYNYQSWCGSLAGSFRWKYCMCLRFHIFFVVRLGFRGKSILFFIKRIFVLLRSINSKSLLRCLVSDENYNLNIYITEYVIILTVGIDARSCRNEEYPPDWT